MTGMIVKSTVSAITDKFLGSKHERRLRAPFFILAQTFRWLAPSEERAALANGRNFAMNACPIQVPGDTVELWDIRNAEKSMPHPTHLHGFLFQVVTRRDSPNQDQKLAQASNAHLVTSLGSKYTTLVRPAEAVPIAIDLSHAVFRDQQYLFHYHNLEHEHAGTMVNCRVTAADSLAA